MHIWILVNCFCFLTISSFCQVPDRDTAMYQAALDHATNQYHQKRGKHSAIYNGLKHIGYSPVIIGSPYFASDDYVKGSVHYDGLFYEHVFLRFDMVTNELIVRNPNGFGVILFSPRVKLFTMAGHHFIYFDEHSKL